jgi:hypothetical protein
MLTSRGLARGLMSYGLGYSGTPSINSRVSREDGRSFPNPPCLQLRVLHKLPLHPSPIAKNHCKMLMVQVFASHLITPHPSSNNKLSSNQRISRLEYDKLRRRRVGRGDLDEIDYWCRYWVENPIVMGLPTWRILVVATATDHMGCTYKCYD